MTNGESGQQGRGLTIWVLQTGEPLHLDMGDRRPMRAMNVANALVAAGHRVVVWSASFSHQEKRHRARRATRVIVSERLEYRLIPSPGYVRNIGVGRLWDHALLALELKRMLRHEIAPDACFIGYPPIEIAAVMARWMRVRGRPSLLDVKDQWPTILLDALPDRFKSLGRLVLSPYYRLARRAMRDATGIVAMSNGFLRWALEFAERPRSPHDLIAPLTSPGDVQDARQLAAARAWWAERGIGEDGKIRFCFVGSQTRSFDFAPVADAARRLAVSHPACELVMCGTGERSQESQQAVGGIPSVLFPGWVDREHVRVLAERSTGFIAPYRSSDDFDQSIPNKVVDAFSLGLPLLTPLQGEVGALIESRMVGLRYGAGTTRTLYDCIVALIDDADLRRTLSANALALFEEQFTYDKVYGRLVEHLESIAIYGRRS
jgi:glycosyltransferase involved in cell wall biosynthesis